MSPTPFRILFGLAFVAVTALTVIPNPGEGPPGTDMTRWVSLFIFGDAQHADKVGHLAAYGVLGALGAPSRLAVPRAWLTGPALLAAWGGCLEIVQGFLAARQTELLDAAANASGAGLGWAAGAALVSLAASLAARRAS